MHQNQFALMIAGSLALAIQGTASRTFDRVLLLESASETSASVSLGDIDGNRTLDVVLAKGRHWPLNDVILRNDGKGKFSTEHLADAPDRTYSAALADLDGDADLDIVASNDKPDRKLIYLNDGKGRFRVSGTFGDPEWNTRYVTVADLNGDKRPDLIVASDLDADGKADLFVPHRDGGQNLVFWNDGTGRFTDPPAAVGHAKSQIRAAAAADINADGYVDLVVGDERNGMFVYLGAGKRVFDAPVALAGATGAPYSIAIADMNRDGRADLVIGRQEAVGSVLFNLGGDRLPKFADTPWGDGKGSVYGVAIGDLDGDGWPDIAAARSEAPNGIWFSGVAR